MPQLARAKRAASKRAALGTNMFGAAVTLIRRRQSQLR
jgi:hypothetical protein